MADWQFLYPYKSVDEELGSYERAIVGGIVKPSTSQYESPDAGFVYVPAGLYRFTFETDTTVSVAAIGDDTNAWVADYGSARTVVCDDVTENSNLFPGWNFVFRNGAAVGDQFDILVGGIFDGTRAVCPLFLGVRTPGFSDSAKGYKVKNVSGESLSACRVVATNAIRIENADADMLVPLASFWQSGTANPIPDEDDAGLEITFDNYAAGSPATVDILVDGDPISIYDVTNDVAIVDGTGLNCDGTTVYRFADGSKHQSGTFILSASLSETDTAQIYVPTGGDYMELSLAGTTFTSGPGGLELTEDGEADGVITDDGEVEFYLRSNLPAEASPSSSLSLFNLRVTGTKGDDSEAVEELIGSFEISEADVQGVLTWQITALRGQYEMPRYSISDPGPPAVYVLDHPDGLYIEDPESPGSYVVASGHESGGMYASIEEILEKNGVTFVSS